MKHRHYSKSEANLCARVHEKDIMSVGNHLIISPYQNEYADNKDDTRRQVQLCCNFCKRIRLFHITYIETTIG
mgnify:CR=1 FL=1